MSNPFHQFWSANSISGDAVKIFLYLRTYMQKRRFLEQSQWWPKSQIEEYQLDQLHLLLRHAYHNVPYYTKMFDNLGLQPRDILDIKDLRKLPYITKKILRDNWQDFRAKNYPVAKLDYITTGGSTGIPLGIYVERGPAQATYTAYLQQVLRWSQCHFMHKQIHLMGFDKPWSYHGFGRVLALSSLSMTSENLPVYIRKIMKFNPEFILGFPSALTILARYLQENNLRLKIKAVVPSGETIEEWQRDFIKETFFCPVSGLYAHNEFAVFAGTCEEGNGYHLFPEYGITELIQETITSDDKNLAHIVATGFNNYAFPLIRYKTEDLCITTQRQCACGRSHPLIENVIGRVQQFIVTKSNRLIPLTGFYGLVAKCTQHVKECQLLQEKEGEVQLFIVPEGNLTEEEEKCIFQSFTNKFHNDIYLQISYIDSLHRTPSGKTPFLIQKLSITN